MWRAEGGAGIQSPGGAPGGGVGVRAGTAILAGRFELAAVVVAIKALGRYPEIRENPAVSERFIIGTLTSLLVAAACGAVGLALLRTLL